MWRHTLEIWKNDGSMAIGAGLLLPFEWTLSPNGLRQPFPYAGLQSGNHTGTHQDYHNYSPHCLYYNWNYLKGADWGSAKTLWKWVGGDQGFGCGYNSEGAMSLDMDSVHVALRISVRPPAAWSHSWSASPSVSPPAVLL